MIKYYFVVDEVKSCVRNQNLKLITCIYWQEKISCDFHYQFLYSEDVETQI